MIWLTALGWLRSAVRAALDLVTRYPLQCALCASLLACAWLWRTLRAGWGIRRVLPTAPFDDCTDPRLIDPKVVAKLLEREPRSIGPDVRNVSFSHNRGGVALAPKVSAMLNFVGAILGWRGPSQMPWIAALRHPAIMRSLMRARRLRPVHCLTDVGVGLNVATPNGKMPVPPALRVGPKQAVISTMGEGYLLQELQRLANGGATGGGVAVIAEPLIMTIAPTPRSDGVVATFNGAYPGISHGVSPHVIGQGRALLTQRFRPDFSSRFMVRSQAGALCLA